MKNIQNRHLDLEVLAKKVRFGRNPGEKRQLLKPRSRHRKLSKPASSLGFQTPGEKVFGMYLDPKNIPKTPSQEAFRRLGVVIHLFFLMRKNTGGRCLDVFS